MRRIAPTTVSRRWTWLGLFAFGPPPLLNPRSLPLVYSRAVVRLAGARGRVEPHVTERVGQVRDDVGHTEQLAPGALEPACARVRRAPLGDDVVVGDVGRREARRDEVGNGGVARRILAVDGVEESVASEFRVEVESDEAALQPAVDRERAATGSTSAR